MSPAIGSSIDRMDGPEKVMGRARYAAEIPLPNITYAAIVGATIPSGRLVAIEASEALAAEGVEPSSFANSTSKRK